MVILTNLQRSFLLCSSTLGYKGQKFTTFDGLHATSSTGGDLMSPSIGGEQELDPRGRRWQERLVRPISHARAVLDVEVQGAEEDGHAMRRSGMGQRWLLPTLHPPPATTPAACRVINATHMDKTVCEEIKLHKSEDTN